MDQQDSQQPSKRVKVRKWSEQEDETLRTAVARHGEANWKEIAEEVQTRNALQCLQRWKKTLRPGLVKGIWSREEDALLIDLMKQFGQNWLEVAARVPGRNAKQCKERFTMILDPNLNRGPWTPEEDKQLEQLHAQLGSRWSVIARHIVGRTEHSVKTRFLTLERKRAKSKGWSDEEDIFILRGYFLNGHERSFTATARQLHGRTKAQVGQRFQELIDANPMLLSVIPPHPADAAAVLDNILAHVISPSIVESEQQQQEQPSYRDNEIDTTVSSSTRPFLSASGGAAAAAAATVTAPPWQMSMYNASSFVGGGPDDGGEMYQQRMYQQLQPPPPPPPPPPPQPMFLGQAPRVSSFSSVREFFSNNSPPTVPDSGTGASSAPSGNSNSRFPHPLERGDSLKALAQMVLPTQSSSDRESPSTSFPFANSRSHPTTTSLGPADERRPNMLNRGERSDSARILHQALQDGFLGQIGGGGGGGEQTSTAAPARLGAVGKSDSSRLLMQMFAQDGLWDQSNTPPPRLSGGFGDLPRLSGGFGDMPRLSDGFGDLQSSNAALGKSTFLRAFDDQEMAVVATPPLTANDTLQTQYFSDATQQNQRPPVTFDDMVYAVGSSSGVMTSSADNAAAAAAGTAGGATHFRDRRGKLAPIHTEPVGGEEEFLGLLASQVEPLSTEAHRASSITEHEQTMTVRPALVSPPHKKYLGNFSTSLSGFGDGGGGS